MIALSFIALLEAAYCFSCCDAYCLSCPALSCGLLHVAIGDMLALACVLLLTAGGLHQVAAHMLWLSVSSLGLSLLLLLGAHSRESASHCASLCVSCSWGAHASGPSHLPPCGVAGRSVATPLGVPVQRDHCVFACVFGSCSCTEQESLDQVIPSLCSTYL
jgi:hypothetical protein